MTSLGVAFKAARELGVEPLALYGAYHVAQRTGLYRRLTPGYRWEDRPLQSWLRPGTTASQMVGTILSAEPSGRPAFFLEPGHALTSALKDTLSEEEDSLLAEADDILQGRFRLFGEMIAELGVPPRWGLFVSPDGDESELEIASDQHWSRYNPEALPADPKLVWEASRFGWVYTLVRAYGLSGNEAYFTGCMDLLTSWRAQNPPNMGPQWVSAQEAALRALALIFAFHGFRPALTPRPEDAERILQMIAVHALRIPPTLIYARAQGNNHLLVEGTALYSVGLLFPDFERAGPWRELGRRWLVYALTSQIFPDGGYVQHSTNYQRFALEAGLWAARLAKANGEPLPDETLIALLRMTKSLAALVDPQTGCTPNFGPNDGGQLLPLSTCPFADFRPTVQAASTVFFGGRALPSGPWDETSLWLGLNPNELSGFASSLDEGRIDYPHAGIFLTRGKRAWGALRCAAFTSRPGHSDQLHFDLWWQGTNLARDAGTYLYSGEPPWQNRLAGAGVHNTVIVENQEPMQRAGRFLWLDWAQGRLIGRWRSQDGGLEVITAAHNGYRELGVTHQRTVVRAGDDLWQIVDELIGEGTFRARLNWLLPDWPWSVFENQLQMEADPGQVTVQIDAPDAFLGVFRAGEWQYGEAEVSEPGVLGWWSPSYAIKEPAVHLVTTAIGPLPLRLSSLFVLGRREPGLLRLEWRTPGLGRVGFSRASYRSEHVEF